MRTQIKDHNKVTLNLILIVYIVIGEIHFCITVFLNEFKQ